MKVKVIGKYGRYCAKNEATNCFLLQTDNGKNIVVDMGSGSLSKLQNYIDIAQIDMVIITHLHFDHMCDLGTLAYAVQYLKMPQLVVYMPKKPSNVASVLSMPQFEVKFIQNELELCVDNIKIQFKNTLHPVETYSLVIESANKKLVYTSDSADEKLIKENCKGANIVICNTCILDTEYKEGAPHCRVKTFAEAVPKDCKMYLAHLTSGDEDKILQEAKQYHSNAEIVCDFEL